ncbi:hypothetical protein QLX08_009081 [Tetragonisca angustula]|uniref:Uncharacterized protein n=1 Tax=Tetragonisca angustula TaxID=166442 RepID=A0AAW0ZJG1_9HYME
MIPYSTCLSFGGRRDARRWVVLHDESSPYPKTAILVLPHRIKEKSPKN